MKKLIAFLLLFAFGIAMLAGCGGSGDSDDPNVGKWTAYAYNMFDGEEDISGFYPNGATIELNSNGNCSLDFNGDKSSGKWTLEGTNFKASVGGADYAGSISNGVLTFEVLTDVFLYFKKEGQ